jgi:proton-translocating NADH-quinone oxidoreductase chain L
VTEAIWLIPALPLAGFLTLVLFGRRLGEPWAGWLATAAMVGSFAATLTVFAGLLAVPEEERFASQILWTWVAAGTFDVDIGFLADPLSIAMCLFITGIGALIHLYSIGYMHGDPNFSKFFVYLNLFAFSMLLLVLGDNLLLTFLGWEGVGVCSYLLISFWFTNPANASAGKKAFVTNRIGDMGFMLAIFLVFQNLGSIRYADILTRADELAGVTATAIVLLLLVAAAGKSAQLPLFVWLPDAMAGPTPVSALIHAATMVTSGVYLLTRMNPVLAESFGWAPLAVAWIGALTALVAATIAVAQTDIKKVLAYSTVSQLGYMFMAVGVGAFVPAVFHMITHAFFKALLFLGSGSVIHGLRGEQDMRRMGGLYRFMPVTAATFIVGWLAIAGVPPFSGFWSKDEILLYVWDESIVLWAIGLVTAVLTAFYMSRQVFLTFFGRLRYPDVAAEEIEAAWGGRVTAQEAMITEANDALAKADEAIEKARADQVKRVESLEAARVALQEARDAVEASSPGADGHDKLVKALEKSEKAVPKAEDAVAKADASGSAADEARAEAVVALELAQRQLVQLAESRSVVPLPPEVVTARTPAYEAGDLDEFLPESWKERQERHPHESPWTMTLPLVVLAVLAAVAGFLNLPFTSWWHHLEHWLEPSLFGNERVLGTGTAMKWTLAGVAILGGVVGIVAAGAVYLRGRLDPRRVEQPVLARGWYIDQTYAAFMGGPGRRLFEAAAWFDRTIIDGAVNGLAGAVRSGGGGLRTLQSGLVRSYALWVTAGSVALLAWFLLRMFA